MKKVTIVKRFVRNLGTGYHVIYEGNDITPFIHGGFTSFEAAKEWVEKEGFDKIETSDWSKADKLGY